MAFGRVKEEVLSVLFANYFPHYKKLRADLDVKVLGLAALYKEDLLNNNENTLFAKIFHKRELTRREDSSISCKTGYDVCNLGKHCSFPCRREIIEVYNAIQDLSKVMEIKATSKRSQGSYVLASFQDLLALERVCDNLEYYKELDLVIDEIEYEKGEVYE